jgi:2-polyprenyl-3-methyl-5-hydroxy-6-metoxy-1,4-benzoquinol methylase
MTGHIKYQFKVDESDPNNAHSLVHQWVAGIDKAGMRILEVGCSSGYVGATFAARGHHVTGVEIDPVAADAARAVLQEVHTGDVETFFAAHPDRRFDAILLGDVLEHMADPMATLGRCAERLAEDGVVAISLPCITHGSIRAMLLEGRWDYADYGLLDRTHLRFFSHRGMAELVSAAGLQIVRLQAVIMPLETASREYGMALRPQSITAVEVLAGDLGLLDFQYVALARLAAPGTSVDQLLSCNLASPVERVPPPRRPGDRSISQRLRIRLLRTLFDRIVRRRFRDTVIP